MTSKHDLELSVKALAAYDDEDYETALQLFESITPNSKTCFNMARLFADLGQHTEAVSLFEQAVSKDAYLAVAFFQCGVSHFQLRDIDQAMRCFNEALFHLRGNKLIDYEQLGLRFRLYACEVLFNRGLCFLQVNQDKEGMRDLRFASSEKQTAVHDIIDEALRDQGEGHTVFSVPQGVLYRPLDQKVRNLAVRNYLGKARLVAAVDETDNGTGFRAYEEMQSRKKAAEPVLEGYATANLVRHSLRALSTGERSENMAHDRADLVSRSGSTSGSTRSEPVQRRISQATHLRSKSESLQRLPIMLHKDLFPQPLRKESAPVMNRQSPPQRPARPGLPGSSSSIPSRKSSNTGAGSQDMVDVPSRRLMRTLPPTPPPDKSSRLLQRSASSSTASSTSSASSVQSVLRHGSIVRPERSLPHNFSAPDKMDSVDEYLALVSGYADLQSVDIFKKDYTVQQKAVSADAHPLRSETQSATSVSSLTQVQIRLMHTQDEDAGNLARVLRLPLGQLMATPLNKLMDQIEAKIRLPVKRLCVQDVQSRHRFSDARDLILLCDEEDLQLVIEDALQTMQRDKDVIARLILHVK